MVPTSSSSKVRQLGTQLALSAVGPGLLALPYGVAEAGLPLGILFMCFSVLISGWVVTILYDAKVGLSKRSAHSYSQLTEAVLGKRWRNCLELIVVLNGLGICISFMIFLGGFAPPAIQTLMTYLFPDSYKPPATMQGERVICLCAFALITIALSSIKSECHRGDHGRITQPPPVQIGYKWHKGELDVTQSLYNSLTHHPTYTTLLTPNIFLFSTMMQVNVLPILATFPDTSKHGLIQSLRLGHGTLFLFYLLLAIVGYVSAATSKDGISPIGVVSQNFTLDLPIEDISVAFLRIVLVITLLSIAPYQFVNVAGCILGFVERKRTQKRDVSDADLATCHSLSASLLSTTTRHESGPSEDEDLEFLGPRASAVDRITHHFSLTSRLLAATGLVTVAFIVALVTDKVATLLSIVGGVGSTTLMCTAPFFIKRAIDPSSKAMWILAVTFIAAYSTTILAVSQMTK
eukprot:Blabericola_migrator_1__134@NODE_1034_length_5642_cov_130_008251_g704_i1_p2_GENE_NODE_1034_length_5642_cov_130_008251_g704_i1NODE_1034_length_5642_cov_130_008251_g704_i1_p2_ORF_typecomplete_len462_score41_28Aa_trans/PF01490_18/1_1e19Aa_trans/PF01490_18/3_4e19Trp_Tyr_perm/PF03222_13/6_6e07Trp_Tyr_perm/PF03222_13/6_8e03DUF4190/PF13828_6/46DUF4190/PF13828_6/3_4e03DUF4190/PF13828_6/98DUF4190/PF13828_6/1_2DUF4190/PF13828_6/1_3e04_NODE_1034_length_5642_cov_130_008251_g704_i128204205